MKNLTKNIQILLIAVFTFSCNQQADVVTPDEPDQIDYAQIGIDHNDGLELMFNNLKAAQDANGPLSPEDALKIMEQSAYDLGNERYPEGMDEYITPAIKYVGDFARSYQNDPVAKNKDFYQVILEEAEKRLSEDQQIFLERIVSAVADNDDLATMHEALNIIERDVRREFSSQLERHPLLSAIYIAKSSSTYWHDNYDKWTDEFGDSSFMRIKGFWGDVGLADLLGGTVVAGTLWMTGLIPGPGWVTYGSAIALGAAVDSAVQAYLTW